MIRRKQQHKFRFTWGAYRSDAIYDPFLGLLRSGIGRHKSFGFGMLKVRRA